MFINVGFPSYFIAIKFHFFSLLSCCETADWRYLIWGTLRYSILLKYVQMTRSKHLLCCVSFAAWQLAVATVDGSSCGRHCESRRWKFLSRWSCSALLKVTMNWLLLIYWLIIDLDDSISYYRVVISESCRKESSVPPSSLVLSKERTRLEHWLELVVCVSFTSVFWYCWLDDCDGTGIWSLKTFTYLWIVLF